MELNQKPNISVTEVPEKETRLLKKYVKKNNFLKSHFGETHEYKFKKLNKPYPQ